MTLRSNCKHALLALGLVCGGMPTAHAASADVEKYPTKPIRLIGPFVPGGGTDITARAIAAKLTERWGQQVIVDNRPGAAGTIGVDLTATAPPDGYTLCLISASHSVNSATNPKLPYDLTKDLQGVSQATSLFYVIYVHPSVPATSVQELITYAKANPDKLNFGSSGTGGLQHRFPEEVPASQEGGPAIPPLQLIVGLQDRCLVRQEHLRDEGRLALKGP